MLVFGIGIALRSSITMPDIVATTIARLTTILEVVVGITKPLSFLLEKKSWWVEGLPCSTYP